MKSLFHRFKEQILYIFFGVCTTLVDLTTYAVSTRVFHLNEYLSLFLAWTFAVLFAFLTNKFFVFESKSFRPKIFFKELTSFVGGRLLTLGLEYVIMFVGKDILHYNDMIVKLVSQVFIVIFNYIFSKLFVFRKKKETK